MYNKKNDSSVVCKSILDYYMTKYTRRHLLDLLESHSDYPSLLAVKDTLEHYGVQSAAIRKQDYNYSDFEVPFICSIQQSDWSHSNFTVVSYTDESVIRYLDPKSYKEKEVSHAEFNNLDKEIILLLDGEQAKDERAYTSNRQKERNADLISFLPLSLMVLAFLSSAIYIFNYYPLETIWFSLFFLLTSTVGVGISSLLIWHEIDSHNPFLKEVCGGQGRKMNCDAVLTSEGAQFLGLSWSLWGFAYFASFFLSLVLLTPQYGVLSVWQLLSLLATPYILYSIYYQWRIVKQWCPLCLSIQAILMINSLAYLILYWRGELFLIDVYTWGRVLMIGLGALIVGHYAIPVIKQSRESKSYERKWKRMRYNPDIFKYLLHQSSAINVNYDDLGIVVGNLEASNEIIKVCNPYCGPCSKAHPELEKIITRNADVRLRIIFTASGA